MRLIDDGEVWYKYGVDYQAVRSEEGDLLTNLISAFLAKGRKRYLLESPEELTRHRQKEIRQVLDRAYVESLWDSYGTGTEYVAKSEISILTNPEEGIICQTFGEYRIVWKLDPTIHVEGDLKRKTVLGRRLLDAESIVLKYYDGRVQVRSSKAGKKFIRTLFKELGVQEIPTLVTAKDLTESLDRILTGKSSGLKLVKVKFLETSLPFRSKLAVANDLGLEPDLGFLKERQVVPNYSITDLKEMTFQLLESGKPFTLKIKLLNAGYSIDIDDKLLHVSERETVRRILEEADLPIRTVCEYQVESNLKPIFHKLLSGSIRAYKKYFEKLTSDTRQLIDSIARVQDAEKWTCQTCGRQFEISADACPECGSDDIIKTGQTLYVDEDSVLDLVTAKLRELKPNFHVGNYAYNDFELSKQKKYCSVHFTRIKTVDHSPIAEPFRFTVVPYSGKENLSKSIDEYLQNCSLVTYGEGAYNERMTGKYGHVDLFELAQSTTETRKDLFHTMVTGTVQGIQDRVVRLSSEAEQRLIHSEELSPKEFERDVFYTFKRILSLSERLGRLGKREADGLLIHINQKGECLISSYDAKHSMSKYVLDAPEQNKAVLYIVDESTDVRINNYTKGRGIISHVIIGNNFDKDKLGSFLNGTAQLLRLLQDNNSKRVPIVLIQLKELQRIYSLYTEHASRIGGDQFLSDLFYSELWKIFRADKDSKIVDSEEVDRFERHFLHRLSTSSYNQSDDA